MRRVASRSRGRSVQVWSAPTDDGARLAYEGAVTMEKGDMHARREEELQRPRGRAVKRRRVAFEAQVHTTLHTCFQSNLTV